MEKLFFERSSYDPIDTGVFGRTDGATKGQTDRTHFLRNVLSKISARGRKPIVQAPPTALSSIMLIKMNTEANRSNIPQDDYGNMRCVRLPPQKTNCLCLYGHFDFAKIPGGILGEVVKKIKFAGG